MLRRIRIVTLAKALSTMLGIGVFFVAYFWVLRHPFGVPTLMPITALDRLIPLQPGALTLYFSLWLYVSIAPALLASKRELVSYGLATLAISVIGFALFMLWPTATPRLPLTTAVPASMQFLRDVDLAANACPSLHVAFAVFTACWMERLLREMHTGLALRIASALWGLGIVYSTLATRQHVLIDVLAGAALGAVVAALHMRALRRGYDAPSSAAAMAP